MEPIAFQIMLQVAIQTMDLIVIHQPEIYVLPQTESHRNR